MTSSASHMSASLSPERGVTSEGEASSSGLDPSLLQTLAEKRTARDGNPQKKRGPKPNSKPAMTRRQELNRQAQRTHRERKELYIKALEDEVLRLKEVFGSVSVDRERLAEENKQLRDALAQHGIPAGSPVSPVSLPPGSSNFTPAMTTKSTPSSLGSSSHITSSDHAQISSHQLRDLTREASGRGGVDVDQAGIDFVLTLANAFDFVEGVRSLEKPCKAHYPFMVERRAGPEGDACGHALMMSFPPDPALDSRSDFLVGHQFAQADPAWSKPARAELATLLDLSKRLDLDGEVTPIMAWSIVLSHPRVHELGLKQFRILAEELMQKVRCYGFGAVMEEFEVQDALDGIFR